MAVWNSIKLKEFPSDLRLDAEYFRPKYVSSEAQILAQNHAYIGELAKTIQRGCQPIYSEEGTIPVVRTVNVRELQLSSARQDFVDDSYAEENPKGRLAYGDVLITSTGIGTLGRVGFFDSHEPAFADGHITYLRSFHGVDPR